MNLTCCRFAGFLRRNRKKEKKGKKKDDGAGGGGGPEENAGDKKEPGGGVGSDGEEMQKSGTPTPEVDEEGYSKQPTTCDPWSDISQNKSNFYSSSDDSGSNCSDNCDMCFYEWKRVSEKYYFNCF